MMTLAFKFSATEGAGVVLVRPESRRISGDLLHLLAKAISSWIDPARHYSSFFLEISSITSLAIRIPNVIIATTENKIDTP